MLQKDFVHGTTCIYFKSEEKSQFSIVKTKIAIFKNSEQAVWQKNNGSKILNSLNRKQLNFKILVWPLQKECTEWKILEKIPKVTKRQSALNLRMYFLFVSCIKSLGELKLLTNLYKIFTKLEQNNY